MTLVTEAGITVRTQQAIVERAREASQRDMFGFESHEYIGLLDFDHAREFLKTDIDVEKMRAEWPAPETLGDLNQRAKDYMVFWLEKIEDERGISVCRATAHFTAWKWLLGHPDADTFPGSIHGGDGGWYQRKAYDYINRQIESGEWERLNAEAIKNSL